MLLNLAQTIAYFFTLRGLLPPQDYDMAVYVLQKRLHSLLCHPVLFALGCWLAGPWRALCFLAVFLSLRRRCGGYHANTPQGCLLGSVLAVGATLGAAPALLGRLAPWGQLALGTEGLAILECLGACDAPGLDLTLQELAANSRRTRLAAALAFAAGAGLLAAPATRPLGETVLTTLFVVAVLLVLGNLKNMRYQGDEL